MRPWESCIFTAEDERNFVRKFLGPTFKRSGLPKVKIIIWDHNRGIMVQRAKVVYGDPEASKYALGMGFHWYVGDHFDNVRWVHDAYPEKQLLLTKGTPASFETQKLGDWQGGKLTHGRS